MAQITREQLIAAGVRNLIEFGYDRAQVNKDNIMTEPVFARFFKSMLEENRGMGADNLINVLIAEIDKNLEKVSG